MTVMQLYRLLQPLVYANRKALPVAVNKRTFAHPLETDGVVIIDVARAAVQWIPMLDDDGFTALRQDGSEAGRQVFLLEGEGEE